MLFHTTIYNIPDQQFRAFQLIIRSEIYFRSDNGLKGSNALIDNFLYRVSI